MAGIGRALGRRRTRRLHPAPATARAGRAPFAARAFRPPGAGPAPRGAGLAPRGAGQALRGAGPALRGAVPALIALLLAGGCVDFAAPRLPNAGAPALLQLSVSLQEAGAVSVSGQVQPGRDSSGVTRVPLDSTLYIAGRAIEADTVLTRNTLVFNDVGIVPREVLAGPITMAGPEIAKIQAPPPFLVWYGIVKVGGDTVFVPRGGDAVLRVNARLGDALPPVQTRQWFLDLSGPAGVIRVSGGGFPPDSMRIPPQWLPATPPATVIASLLYYQSAQTRDPPGDYIGNVAMDARLQWVVRLQ